MSRIRTSIITGVTIAGLSVSGAVTTPAADAASAKSGAKKAFTSAFAAAKSGNYTKFCKSFTKSSLKGFGGLSSCRSGVAKVAGGVAKSKVTVTGVSASGSRASVKWKSKGTSHTTTLKKESGKWKLVKVLG